MHERRSRWVEWRRRRHEHFTFEKALFRFGRPGRAKREPKREPEEASPRKEADTSTKAVTGKADSSPEADEPKAEP